MIIRVKKYLVYGILKEKDLFFKRAQQLGSIEFIGDGTNRKGAFPETIKEIMSAIKVLRHLPFVETPLEQHISVANLSKRINDLFTSIESLEEESKWLANEIDRIAPFGEFSFEDIEYLKKDGKRIFQFFCAKKSDQKKVQNIVDLVYVGSKYDLDYFVAVNKEKKQYPDTIEITIEKSLKELKTRLFDVKKQKQSYEEELKSYTGYLDLLREEVVEHLNRHALVSAKEEVSLQMENTLFSVEAWVPKTHIKNFQEILKDLSIEYVEIAVEAKDIPPTYMENKGAAKIGEDLVNIYDVPAADDKDPSFWVLCAFSLFFAMITSDAGYGFIYLILAFFLERKFPILSKERPRSRDLLRRVIQLVKILSVSCILWGFVVGSFFGISIGPDNVLHKVTLINYVAEKKAEYHLQKKDDVYLSWERKYPALKLAKTGKEFFTTASVMEGKHKNFEALDDFKNNILLEISLLVGALHVMLGCLRYMRYHWAGIGWFFFIMGGYLYFPKLIQATSLLVYLGIVGQEAAFGHGLQLLLGGMTLAMVMALLQKGWGGLQELMHVVQVFADVLSYLRLYALGFAATIMASTFNQLGESIPFAAGILVILLGHMVNISLGIMVGIIHGLRLNFLEWYRYCFQGNGKLLNPLKLLK